jgi:hypothetical protein
MAAAPPPAAEAEPPLLSSEPALLIAPAAPPLLEPPPLLAVPPPTPPDPPPLVAVTPAAEPRPTPRAAPLPRSKRQPLANPATPARAPLPAAAQRAPQDKGAKPPGGPPQLKTDAERLKPTWKVYAGIVFVPTAAIGLFFLGKLLFGATPARSEAAPVVIGQDKAAPRPKPTTSPPRPAGQLPATKPAARYQPLDLERAATAFGAKLRFGDQLAEGLPLPKGAKPVEGVPFDLVDPQNGEVKNVIVLHSKGAAETRELPQRVIVPCEATVKALHLLGGVAGWGHPASPAGSVSLKVRFVGKDGLLEEHALKNGAHLANVAGADDVPESRPALKGEGWQVRYLAIPLGKPGFVRNIELVKGEDGTAPIIVALTVERPNN